MPTVYDDVEDQFQGYPSGAGRRGSSILVTIVVSALTSAGVFFGLRELEARGLLGERSRPTATGTAVEVPNVVGVRVEQGRDLLKVKELLLSIAEEREDATRPPGVIVSQQPLAGSEAQLGTTVQVAVSRAVASVVVPPAVAIKPEEAVRLLTAAGLQAGPQRTAPSDTVAPGLVVQTEPPAGTAVQAGSTVTLVVAGVAGKAVPKVVGMRLPKGKKLLEDAGFKVGKPKYLYDPCCGEYIILKQTPAETTEAPVGSTIELTVNEPG